MYEDCADDAIIGIAGQRFAMMSGTSMATPHVAGLAAMLKAKYPTWSPAALSSAMATTADVADRQGRPIQAQQPSAGSTPFLQAATPFDMGGGALNLYAALNPGLIFEAGNPKTLLSHTHETPSLFENATVLTLFT